MMDRGKFGDGVTNEASPGNFRVFLLDFGTSMHVGNEELFRLTLSPSAFLFCDLARGSECFTFFSSLEPPLGRFFLTDFDSRLFFLCDDDLLRGGSFEPALSSFRSLCDLDLSLFLLLVIGGMSAFMMEYRRLDLPLSTFFVNHGRSVRKWK